VRGEITLKILETIKEAAYLPFELAAAILISGYGASMSKMEYNLDKLQRERKLGDFDADQKSRLSKMMHKLRHEGLVVKNKGGFLNLTEKGLQRLERLKLILRKKKNSAENSKNKESSLKIIAFDIPEKYRSKRDWLRHSLASLGFTMLQKSVWIGKIGLPEDFIEDLRRLDLIPHTEIFSINKTGTLKQIS
jgi:hypothetical protein